MEQIRARLERIYGSEQSAAVFQRLSERVAQTQAMKLPKPKAQWSEDDVVLITYGDQFSDGVHAKIAVFQRFFRKYLQSNFTVTHILPFYPYSSDDGFSVIDYKAVNPDIGNWHEIEALSADMRLMFDFVCNHISAKSQWFKEYLAGNAEYQNFFINVDPQTDLSAVTRPRALPLLTEFATSNGTEHLWTTFSEDQIDLNFANPEVLLAMVDVLLFYIEHHAEWIRLDAVGFLWKEIGTSCIHHPLTHEFIKLFRDIVNVAAYGTVLITETNVPHKDNVAYFGDGTDEAQMVYQFPLPPLVLHAIKTGQSTVLQSWAKTLSLPGSETTYFNFLSSHDGIGLNPIRGIIAEDEILALVADLKENGALVSNKVNPDGSESPYEVNVTYFNALSNIDDSDQVKIAKHLLAHSILLTFLGVPAIYIHSILGSQNNYVGVNETHRNRTINREKFDFDTIDAVLQVPSNVQSMVLERLSKMIAVRKKHSAFHPNAEMLILETPSSIFGYQRISRDREEVLTVIHNVTDKQQSFTNNQDMEVTDVLSGRIIKKNEVIQLEPFACLWLK